MQCYLGFIMNVRALSTLIEDYIAQIPKNGLVALDDVIEAFHERGIAFLLLIFAAPMALPIPVPPGINIILASPLILLTAQQMGGAHKIWLPQRVRRRTLESGKLSAIFRALIPWLVRIEKLLKPRLPWITLDGASRLFGLLGFIMALCVCIPLPLTNTVPSLGIAIMAIGFIMRDGLAVLTGALIGMIWISILVGATLIFGPEAFEIIKETIKSILT